MKKSILWCVFFFVSLAFSNAQTDIILRGGLHSILSSESTINSTQIKGGRMGWNLGIDVALGNHFFVQPGAHFYSSSLSLTGNDSLGIKNFKESSRVNSLRFPVLLGLSPFDRENNGIALSVLAGIVPAVNIAVVKSTSLVDSQDLAKFNFSGKLGANLELGSIILGVDYEFGLNKLFENAKKNFSIIGANIGYKF